ncbi:site-specific integrase [Nocardiopsis exhalans]|uniref:Site-specific integrase n=1 Tax=Nocardiopsis exhalans TaxID=163604 RepID=A0ABY5D9L5_9ACTN|nr:tyrosine-type recombinase/integrase [Nocardiopsis exhalans]USY20436.1 site-specific integrase [Nocardiopsis exhalans]
MPEVPHQTVPELVQGWLESNKAHWAMSTYNDYETIWRLFIAPALGKVRLSELTCQHLNRLYAAMGDKETSALDAYERKLRRRLQQARAESARKTPWRPSSPGRIHKVHAVIRSALTHACRVGLLAHNPAQYVTLPRVPYRRALVWTPERTESWRRTGERPSAVMAWTEGQAGWFLDQIEETEYRDHSLFHLALTRGPRCQEMLNLQWRDLSLEDSGAVAIHGTKTPRSQRTISLGKENVAQLRKWRKVQQAEREKAGKKWVQSDYVFTDEDGKRLTRHQLRDKLIALTKKADLPPIRVHDLRHCAASYSLSAGTSLKVISKMLGHRNYKFTPDTYVHVMPKCDEAAAEAVTRVIPRLAA